MVKGYSLKNVYAFTPPIVKLVFSTGYREDMRFVGAVRVPKLPVPET
jgi:hypothetical protein